jgi:vacuole morphology and inheritance protein 14
LLRFLSDANQDVHVATQQALEGFLAEIKRIAGVKRGIQESRKSRSERAKTMSDSGSTNTDDALRQAEKLSLDDSPATTATPPNEKEGSADGSWIPGQDVTVDHQKVLEILIPYLDSTGRLSRYPHINKVLTVAEEEIQLMALRWIDNFFEICPEDMLPFVPRLLSHVLPAIAHESEMIRQAAVKVNTSLLELIVSLADDVSTQPVPSPTLSRIPTKDSILDQAQSQRRDPQARQSISKESDIGRRTPTTSAPTPPPRAPTPSLHAADLDYSATVSALTLQFLNEQEQTRVAALEWLLMLHRKAPRKVRTVFIPETF